MGLEEAPAAAAPALVRRHHRRSGPCSREEKWGERDEGEREREEEEERKDDVMLAPHVGVDRKLLTR
jgi:ribosomal protein L12E/L44/L45/RPP1/RPP2